MSKYATDTGAGIIAPNGERLAVKFEILVELNRLSSELEKVKGIRDTYQSRLVDAIAQRNALLAACKAVRARIKGEYDDPDLGAFGPLSDMTGDVLAITSAAIKEASK